MSDRPCEVWAYARTWRRRLLDWIRYGHAQHGCQRSMSAFATHDGDHQCRCGLRYAQLSTDNG